MRRLLLALTITLGSAWCWGQTGKKVESTVVFGNCSGSCEIDRENALALDSLYVKKEVGENIQVIQFVFTIMTTPNSYSAASKSSKLTPKMKIALAKIKKGDTIIVDVIKIKYPGGKIKDARGITLTVK